MRPWLGPLLEAIGSALAPWVVFVVAIGYDAAHMMPSTWTLAAAGAILAGRPIREAARSWLLERRAPVRLLPEVVCAMKLVPLVEELGEAVVLRAVEDVAHRRELGRGHDAR